MGRFGTKFTQSHVDRLQTGTEVIDHFDVSFPRGGSFGIRLRPSGRKSFFLLYRDKEKVQRRISLGNAKNITLRAAKEKALMLFERICLDLPIERQIPVEISKLSELVEAYVGSREGKISRNTLRSYRGLLRREIRPRFGSVFIEFASSIDVSSWLAEIANTRPSTALRVYELLRASIAWGIRGGLLEERVLNSISSPNIQGRKKSNASHLSIADLRNAWSESEKLATEGRAYVRLLILTGMKTSELKKLQWIDIESGSIKIKGETFELGPHAEVELKRLREYTSCSQFLFVGKDGFPRKTFRRSFEKIGFRESYIYRSVRDFTGNKGREVSTEPIDWEDKIVKKCDEHKTWGVVVPFLSRLD